MKKTWSVKEMKRGEKSISLLSLLDPIIKSAEYLIYFSTPDIADQ